MGGFLLQSLAILGFLPSCLCSTFTFQTFFWLAPGFQPVWEELRGFMFEVEVCWKDEVYVWFASSSSFFFGMCCNIICSSNEVGDWNSGFFSFSSSFIFNYISSFSANMGTLYSSEIIFCTFSFTDLIFESFSICSNVFS